MGPVLFNIFSHYLNVGTECTPREIAEKFKGCVVIQRDLNRIEKWTSKGMKFSKVLLGWKNRTHQ